MAAVRLVPLPADFYNRPTERVARELLGCIIETTVRGVRCRARIVETEAYLGEHDPACHAAAGRTARTEVLYGAPGRSYVYFIYGMYWCANAVTRADGLPSAVLIRAAEPIEGVEAMWLRRAKARRLRDLTSGPGRLCQALGITGPEHHDVALWRGEICHGHPECFGDFGFLINQRRLAVVAKDERGDDQARRGAPAAAC